MLIGCTVSAQQLFGPKGDYYLNDDFYQPGFGFEAGLNISNITGKRNYKTNSLAGFNAGLSYTIPLADPVSFVPGASYSQRGYKAITADGEYTQRTQYVDFPLIAKIKAGSRINFFIGPEYSLLITRQNSFNAGFNPRAISYYDDSHNRGSLFDGVFGLSVTVIKSFDIHVKYAIDLTQTGANGNGYVPGYSNELWQIGFGYKL